MRFIGKHIFDFPILIRGQVADSTGVAAPADGRVLQSTTGGKVIWSSSSFPTGTGTTSKLAKWTSSSALGSTDIERNGSYLTIGDDDADHQVIERKARAANPGSDLSIFSGDGKGTNNSGGDLFLAGGRSTGSAAGGEVIFVGVAAGSSGSGINNTAHVASISNVGNFQCNGTITTGSTVAINHLGQIQVANQSNITGVGTITSGVWNGTTIAAANGGTGLNSISTLLNSNTTKSDVDLGNVDNKSSATIRSEIVSGDIPDNAANTTGNAATATKQICVTTHNFQMNNVTDVFVYMPFNNLNESSEALGSNQYWARTIAPYAGTIKKVAVRSHTSLGPDCKIRVSKITDTTDGLPAGTHVTSGSIDLSTAATTVITTIGTNSFAAGNVVNVALSRSAGTSAKVVVSVVWEYTT